MWTEFMRRSYVEFRLSISVSLAWNPPAIEREERKARTENSNPEPRATNQQRLIYMHDNVQVAKTCSFLCLPSQAIQSQYRVVGSAATTCRSLHQIGQAPR